MWILQKKNNKRSLFIKRKNATLSAAHLWAEIWCNLAQCKNNSSINTTIYHERMSSLQCMVWINCRLLSKWLRFCVHIWHLHTYMSFCRCLLETEPREPKKQTLKVTWAHMWTQALAMHRKLCPLNKFPVCLFWRRISFCCFKALHFNMPSGPCKVTLQTSCKRNVVLQLLLCTW